MTGKDIRLGKLFSKGSAVIVAADHGSYMGPFPGILNLKRDIQQFKKADAFLLMPGMAKQCKDFFSDKEAPLCVIRINWASHYCKNYMKGSASKSKATYYKKGYNVKLCDVEYAVSLGADMVIVSLLFGTDEEANTRNISEFGQFAAQADRLGIPLIGEFIPFGGIDRYNGDLDDLLLGTRACAEFGADLIKTVFVDNFEEVTASSPVPTLALGGSPFDRPTQAFKMAKDAIQKGAGGIVFGRNVICAQDPKSYLSYLIDVVKHGCGPDEAEKDYLSGLNP